MGLQDALLSALQVDGIALEPLKGVAAARVDGLGQPDAFDVVVQWSDEDQTVIAYAVSAHRVPADRRASVMELVTRINFGLVIGCFELDLDDGELRFRASVDLEGATQDATGMKNVVFAAAATYARYQPSLVDVVGGMVARDALARIDLDVIERSSP